MYRDMPIHQRLNKIGELLAKGVYLYIQKQKEEAKKKETKQENNIAVDKNSLKKEKEKSPKEIIPSNNALSFRPASTRT